MPASTVKKRGSVGFVDQKASREMEKGLENLKVAKKARTEEILEQMTATDEMLKEMMVSDNKTVNLMDFL